MNDLLFFFATTLFLFNLAEVIRTSDIATKDDAVNDTFSTCEN